MKTEQEILFGEKFAATLANVIHTKKKRLSRKEWRMQKALKKYMDHVSLTLPIWKPGNPDFEENRLTINQPFAFRVVNPGPSIFEFTGVKYTIIPPDIP